MNRLITIVIGILLLAPAACMAENKPAAGGSGGVFVPGRFISVAGAPDGSAYLLGVEHRVVRVMPDGSWMNIDLPKIVESKKTDRFCDLAADEKTISFCGYPFPVVFVLNPREPDTFEIAGASDQEAGSLRLMNITRYNDGWRVRDADGVVFEMAAGKPLKRLPDHAALEAGPRGGVLVLPPPGSGKGALQPGRVQKEDGSLLWVPPAPKAPRRVMSVEYLGFDRKQRYVFSVMTGSGELDTEFALYAVKSGQVVASRVIPGPAGLEMQNSCRLAPDGSILLVRAADGGREGVILSRLALE